MVINYYHVILAKKQVNNDVIVAQVDDADTSIFTNIKVPGGIITNNQQS